MQAMLFIFPESATMQKVPLEGPFHIFFFFPMMHLTTFFKALNFTMSSQTVEQVTCKYKLYYMSDVLNWALPPDILGLKLAGLRQTLPVAYPKHPFSPSSLINRISGILRMVVFPS